MKIKAAFLTLAFLACLSSAHATVTIHFDDPFGDGFPDGLKNASGVATSGMQWGVIVSTSDSTFAGSGLSYDAYAAGSATAGFLSSGGSLTDDYFIPGALTKTPPGGYAGADGGLTAGAGSIIDPITIPFGVNGISSTDKFALVWFGSPGSATTAGSKYGFFTDASFIVGSDGGDPIFASLFTGTTNSGLSTNGTFASVAPVPEPSRALLLGFGAVGLMFRRRRA